MAVWKCPECGIEIHPSWFKRYTGRVPNHLPGGTNTPKCPTWSDCHECRACDGLESCLGSYEVPLLDTTKDLT